MRPKHKIETDNDEWDTKPLPCRKQSPGFFETTLTFLNELYKEAYGPQ